MKTCVKICGITNVIDALAVAQFRADFIGVIVGIDDSIRSVPIAEARIIRDTSPVPVILLVEKPYQDICSIVENIKPHGIQLVGNYAYDVIRKLKDATGCALWKTVHVPQNKGGDHSARRLYEHIEHYRAAGIEVIVLDTMVHNKKGGTGQTCDWDIAEKLVADCSIPIFLAGGITPRNVREAVTRVKPYGIDLSSGVEHCPGKKDPDKISLLMQNIRALSADLAHHKKGNG